MKISVSVIVPVYNVQDYLPQCLDSLYSQIDNFIEVILVNDGSTDNSLDICEKYAGKNTNTIIINTENGGLSEARNAGTKVAKGEYIYYLDSDDWIAPNAIKSLYDYAINNKCEIVQGGFYYAYEDYLLYDKSRKFSQVLNREEAMLELIKNDFVKNFAWGKLYKSDIVRHHLFPKGKYFEDSYWQHLIVHECNNYGIIPIPFYYYRQRPTSISGEFSKRNLDLLKGYEERLIFIQDNYPCLTKQMVSALWDMGYLMTDIAYKSGCPEIEKYFDGYWGYLNKTYRYLFEQSINREIIYNLYLYFQPLLFFYNIYKRIIAKIKTFRKYSIIKLKKE